MSIYFKGKEIKYIASDLDGTLLYGEGHALDDETYDLIEQCVSNDIVFIIASGRTYDNELVVLKPIADKVSYIAGSGTICVHNGETILSYMLNKNDACQIYDISDSLPECHVFLSTTKGYYTNSKSQKFLDHMRYNVKMPLQQVEDLRDIDEEIVKVSVFGADGADKICSLFNDNLPNLNVVTSGKNWLDFLIPSINKGSTLKELLKILNIDPEDGLAFGDQGNDIELIQTAGIGYCMKTGVEEAKKAADYVIDTPKTVLKELLKGC